MLINPFLIYVILVVSKEKLVVLLCHRDFLLTWLFLPEGFKIKPTGVFRNKFRLSAGIFSTVQRAETIDGAILFSILSTFQKSALDGQFTTCAAIPALPPATRINREKCADGAFESGKPGIAFHDGGR